jgi:hypothetical protein
MRDAPLKLRQRFLEQEAFGWALHINVPFSDDILIGGEGSYPTVSGAGQPPGRPRRRLRLFLEVTRIATTSVLVNRASKEAFKGFSIAPQRVVAFVEWCGQIVPYLALGGQTD